MKNNLIPRIAYLVAILSFFACRQNFIPKQQTSPRKDKSQKGGSPQRGFKLQKETENLPKGGLQVCQGDGTGQLQGCRGRPCQGQEMVYYA